MWLSVLGGVISRWPRRPPPTTAAGTEPGGKVRHVAGKGTERGTSNGDFGMGPSGPNG